MIRSIRQEYVHSAQTGCLSLAAGLGTLIGTLAAGTTDIFHVLIAVYLVASALVHFEQAIALKDIADGRA